LDSGICLRQLAEALHLDEPGASGRSSRAVASRPAGRTTPKTLTAGEIINSMPQAHADAVRDDLFGEVISTYTDEDALDDGILVDLSQFTAAGFAGLPVNRMTRHLFVDLEPFAQEQAEMLYHGKIGHAFGALLSQKLRFATGDSGNRGEIGDICSIPPNLWLVRNEVGGWTAMYPEDY